MKRFVTHRAVLLVALIVLGALIAQCGGSARSIATGGYAAASHRIDLVPREPGNREQYDKIDENPFIAVSTNPRSTFSIDVDRASYANVRRFLMEGKAPPRDAVRIEELINYFPYDYAEPDGDAPVALNAEVGPAPWRAQHRLVRIGLQAKRLDLGEAPPAKSKIPLLNPRLASRAEAQL